MTASPELSIAHLDWPTIQCQCPVHDCKDNAGWVVAIHAIGRCNRRGLDPDGNRVELRCRPCVERLHAEVAEKLGRLVNLGLLACPGCGAPINNVSDIIRSVEAL